MQPTDDGGRLRDFSCALAPDLADILQSAAGAPIWAQPVKTGKALEIAAFVSLLHTIRESADVSNVEIPIIFETDPHLFYARNEIPHHHGAQPGHGGALATESPRQRFVGALTPKFTFDHAGDHYAVFREGIPVHYLREYVRSGETYGDRPDVAICRGTFRSAVDEAYASAHWKLGSDSIEVAVRTVNAAKPQVVEYVESGPEMLAATAMVEVSWRKGQAALRSQLARYRALFGPMAVGRELFVSGTKMNNCPVPQVMIDGTQSADLEPIAQWVNTFLS